MLLYYILYKSKDRLAFVRFNRNVHIVFELQEKGSNKLFLRQHIYNAVNVRAEGQTAFFDTLWHALKLFERAPCKPDHA